MTLGNFSCTPGADQPWLRITVTNVHDGNGYPVCLAKAFDRGQPLFDADVRMYVVSGEPSGPQVASGTTLRLTWYFDVATDDPSYVQHTSWVPSEITRYFVTCHRPPLSQVPI